MLLMRAMLRRSFDYPEIFLCFNNPSDKLSIFYYI